MFDLHGGHSEKGVGTIKLKDEIVTVYDLVGEVKMSPIVILSSCDTSPIDRNHNTTSNAFFLAGAKTVLASALPLTSHEASIFITRLLLRVKHYLPKRLAGNEGIRMK
ncbi:CHAT domain-containing protein [Pseudoalteromonas sp. S558]|uniref:CHAT domain-containing protein n=1 Tax=Pseudoalteromonas sp. S558 TaxID=2066515 RepID=UPI0025A49CC6|nr:CHAT domain-containing protein [Pseudoalteromonas sp. S558]